MEGKLIYKEVSEYYKGPNPFDDKVKYVFESNGKFYKHTYIGNHTYEADVVEELTEVEIPEEYENDDGEYRKSLKVYGPEEQEMHEINLENCKLVGESLENIKKEEKLARKREEIANAIEKNPMYSEERITESEMTEEQKEVALKLRAKILSEIESSKTLTLETYESIFENLEDIVSGKAIITTHKFSSQSHPQDRSVNLENLEHDSFSLATDGTFYEHTGWIRKTRPEVHKLVKSQDIDQNQKYYGSYFVEGYPVDIIKSEEGEIYLEDNLYKNWANSQSWDVKISELPCERFDVDTGEVTPELTEVNEQLKQEKMERVKFAQEVMRAAKAEFGLSHREIKDLLKFAGSVRALALATEFSQAGLSTKQAMRMLRKTSHRGLESVLAEQGIEYPETKFDVIQGAAEAIVGLDVAQMEEREGRITLNDLQNALSKHKEEKNPQERGDE